MELEIGAIQEGKVTGITKFGAFVLLPGGKSGLVHISEIANAYVNDVNDYLKVGDAVKVKILSVNEAGKINLSIKKAEDPAPQQRQERRPPRPSYASQQSRQYSQRQPMPRANGPTGDVSFEDKLKQFMQESDSRMAGNRLYNDRSRGRRRGGGNGRG